MIFQKHTTYLINGLNIPHNILIKLGALYRQWTLLISEIMQDHDPFRMSILSLLRTGTAICVYMFMHILITVGFPFELHDLL